MIYDGTVTKRSSGTHVRNTTKNVSVPLQYESAEKFSYNDTARLLSVTRIKENLGNSTYLSFLDLIIHGMIRYTMKILTSQNFNDPMVHLNINLYDLP